MRGANDTHTVGTEIMWEMLGYLAVGLACITCAIVIGAAFD
jgi:F0F1-type ATP synthase membrane subunit c/vacuolar-type H+-ATPase subunit K